jgi:hypothetical protein
MTKYILEQGQIVIAQGHIGTFKVIEVSKDGGTADIQSLSLSKQGRSGATLMSVPCSTIFAFHETTSQAAMHVVRQATEEK